MSRYVNIFEVICFGVIGTHKLITQCSKNVDVITWTNYTKFWLTLEKKSQLAQLSQHKLHILAQKQKRLE